MQQLSAVHTIPCHLARFALLFAAIAFLRNPDRPLDGLEPLQRKSRSQPGWHAHKEQCPARQTEELMLLVTRL